MKLRYIIQAIITAALTLAALSCSDNLQYGRKQGEPAKKVFIYMGLGFNNLSNYLQDDITELASNDLPVGNMDYNVLLVFSHKIAKPSDYKTPTSPTLTQIYKNRDGSVVKDTLLVMEKGTISASAETISTILNYVKDHFPSESYGMLMSSHGTGWAPEDYCYNPTKYEGSSDPGIWRSLQMSHPTPKPFLEDLSVDGLPAVKGIGIQNVSSDELIEMDITELSEAIPMKMDYIIFDACFMGGIEVAYELREKCDKLIFSQTEILADGMDYKTLTSYLLKNGEPDLKGFCENYYQYYNTQSGSYQSATISFVDCNQLGELATACKSIFERRNEGICSLAGSSRVQKYYRSSYSSNHGWFFDLADVITKCGASTEEINEIKTALSQCVLYKAATQKFINLDIYTHCGLSMYIPYKDRTYLNDFYKTLEWNKATGLVK